MTTLCLDNPSEHKIFANARIDIYGSDKPAILDEFQMESDEDSPIPLPQKRDILMKPSEFYSLFVSRSEEECEKELQAPQRSHEWLQARKFSITASQFGTAAGLSPYQTSDELVIEKLWNTFEGNAATQWGNMHEKHAKEVFCNFFSQKYQNYTFMEENLMKFAKEPWMAASPDGIVKYEEDGVIKYDLVEFKCPAYLRNTQNHPYAKFNNIPPHYKAQIQGIMGYLNNHTLMNFSRCWFVVWQPHQTWITEEKFEKDYYLKLHEKLEKWYFSKMLPSFTHQYNGLLIKGSAQPQEEMALN